MDSGDIGLLGRCALVGAALFGVLGIYSLGVVLPQIAQAFEANPHSALLSQFVGTLVGSSFAVAAPLLGGLVARIGYRTVYLWSALVFTVAGTSVLLLDNIYLILLTRIVLGFSVAGALVASLAGIGGLAEAQRTKLFGMQAFMGAVLAVAGFVVVGALARYGWRAPFALHVLGLLMIPLILALPRHVHTPVSGQKVARPSLRGLSPIFLLLIAFVGMAGILPGTFGPFYMVHLGITDPALIALPLMCCAATAMVAALSYGWFVNRLGISAMFMLAFLILGSGLFASGWAGTVPALCVTLGLTGIGATFFTPNMNAAAVVASPNDAASAIGLANGVLYGSQALFPFVVEAIKGQAGPSAVFIGFGACALLIGLVHAARAIRARGHPTAVVTPPRAAHSR